MRFSRIAALAALTVSVQAAEAEPVREDTVFDGVTVPPYIELTPQNWAEEVNRTQYLFVKHYSPYCSHCKKFAPTWQTIYEWYYTSKPPVAGLSFTDFYDFRFASINCVAYYDLCMEHDIKSYPTSVMFRNGTITGAVRGAQNMSTVSGAIEEALEESKPGSRPSELLLPSPGDTHSIKVQNADGLSVELSSDNFEQLVTSSQDPWFIKFYAPWCHHCQALAPTWEQLGKSMRKKLNIGEVNCDKEAYLCKQFGVRGFPTLQFFKGSEKIEYQGLRGLGDFIQYSESAVSLASGVPNVNATTLEKMEKKDDVVFVYFYDHATTSEDFEALERLPLNLIGHAKLVKTNDTALAERFKITTFPRLLVSREGRPTYYTPLTPDEMRDVEELLAWMKSVWLPLVPEMTATNARQVMDHKVVALAILDRNEDARFQKSLGELKDAANEFMDRQIVEFQLERKKLRDAKQARIEEAQERDDQRALRTAKAIRIDMDSTNRKEVGFAWVDGVFWQRWLLTTYGIDIKDGERIIINDEDRKRYWDTTAGGNNILISRTAILETLDKVVYHPSTLRAKSTLSAIGKLFFDIGMAFVDHPFMSTGFLLCAIVLGFSWFRGRLRRGGRTNYFHVENALGIKEVSGHNGYAKAD